MCSNAGRRCGSKISLHFHFEHLLIASRLAVFGGLAYTEEIRSSKMEIPNELFRGISESASESSYGQTVHAS